MMQPPLSCSEAAAKQVQAYRGRHVPTTWAASAKMTPEEKAALSNWKETKDAASKEVASSMAHLYSQSKVRQSAEAKYLFIESLASTLLRADNFDLQWAEYNSQAVICTLAMRVRAAQAAEDNINDEGDTMARTEGAKLGFRPSDLDTAAASDRGSLPVAEGAGSESSPDSSSSSSTIDDMPSENETARLAAEIEVCDRTWAGFARTQKTGPVHLSERIDEKPDIDAEDKYPLLCGKRIFKRNAEHGSVLELRSHFGRRIWCEQCRVRAPARLSAIFIK